MNPTDKLRAIVKTNSAYSDLDGRLQYNENINCVPNYFKDISLVGPKGILVKLYKFTKHTTTKGGLITPKYKGTIKDSGRPGVNLDDFVYQARGIILNISDEAKKVIKEQYTEDNAKKFVPGATIWINPAGGVSPHNQFLYDRIHPVVEAIDYLVINPAHVDAFEDTTPIRTIEYVDVVIEDNPKEYELSE